jgi:hypothetical protein
LLNCTPSPSITLLLTRIGLQEEKIAALYKHAAFENGKVQRDLYERERAWGLYNY